jgi:Ca2+-binding EF-hand superfamily protein
LLQEIDPNHDGKVSFQEFVQLLGKLEARLSNQTDMSNDDGVNLEIEIKEGQDMKTLEFLR